MADIFFTFFPPIAASASSLAFFFSFASVTPSSMVSRVFSAFSFVSFASSLLASLDGDGALFCASEGEDGAADGAGVVYRTITMPEPPVPGVEPSAVQPPPPPPPVFALPDTRPFPPPP